MSDGILETDADKLFELVKKEKNIKSIDAAKKLNIGVEEAISLGEILEEDELIELHYPPIGEPFFIYNDPATKKQKKEEEEKKKTKPKSGQLKLLGIVLSSVFLMLSIGYKNNPEIFNDMNEWVASLLSESYLDMNTILIIATVFTIVIVLIMVISLRIRKKRLKQSKGKENEVKRSKESQVSKKPKEVKKEKRRKKKAAPEKGKKQKSARISFS